MSVRGAGRLSQSRDELTDLLRVVEQLRWRLGCERLLRYVLRGVVAAALALLVLTPVLGAPGNGLGDPLWPLAVGLLPLLALALGVARWPSSRQAARVADRRLGLDERLGTAVELAPALRRGAGGRLDGLQVSDALRSARAAPGWPALPRLLRWDGVLALLAAGLAASGLLWLAVGRGPSGPRQDADGASAPQLADAPASSPTVVVATAPPPDPAAAEQPQPGAPQATASLGRGAPQEAAQRAALDSLAQELRRSSASASAADALARGDYAAAGTELATLGDEADQLSDAAKRQLAGALQSAAGQAKGDRQLAQRERQAAQALGRSDYAAQQQALSQLGDQVQRSGASVPAPAQVQRDAGQPHAAGAANGQRPAASDQATTGSGTPGQAGEVAPAGSGDGDGQPGGSGAGTGTTASMLGDPLPRLDAAGQRVEVPVELSGGFGARPSPGGQDGTDAPLGGAGIGSVAEAASDQQTGQLAPERNLVPGDQRHVVRGYFNGDAGR